MLRGTRVSVQSVVIRNDPWLSVAMRIDIVTIFPEAIQPYLATSILKRAQEKRHVTFRVHDLRKWGLGKRRTLDDKPYGGGVGMVMMVAPFASALKALRALGPKSFRAEELPNRNSKALKPSSSLARTRVLLTSAKGKLFTQRDAERYAKKYDRLVILCGHYEGVDERVAKYLADEEISIGPYVLTGGELPALIIADAVTRLIPGVLGNTSSLRDESYKPTAASRKQYGSDRLKLGAVGLQLEYPHYTRPADFSPRRGIHWRVPAVLLTGDHQRIRRWREAHRRSSL